MLYSPVREEAMAPNRRRRAQVGSAMVVEQAATFGALERGQGRRPYQRTVQLRSEALGLDEAGRASLTAAVLRRSATALQTIPIPLRSAPGPI